MTTAKQKKDHYKCLFFDDQKVRIGVNGEAVLKDLASFCYAYKTTILTSPVSGNIDPIASAVAQGRREVWLRIQAMINLEDEQLLRPYTYIKEEQ